MPSYAHGSAILFRRILLAGPAASNDAAERFFRTPFVERDRINDTVESLEKLRAAAH